MGGAQEEYRWVKFEVNVIIINPHAYLNSIFHHMHANRRSVKEESCQSPSETI